MKKIIGLVIAILLIAGCSRKEDIPSINQKYIGLWYYEVAESEYTLKMMLPLNIKKYSLVDIKQFQVIFILTETILRSEPNASTKNLKLNKHLKK